MAEQKRLQYKPQQLSTISVWNLLTWRKTQQQHSRQTRPHQHSSRGLGLAHCQYLHDSNLRKAVHAWWKWKTMNWISFSKLR